MDLSTVSTRCYRAGTHTSTLDIRCFENIAKLLMAWDGFSVASAISTTLDVLTHVRCGSRAHCICLPLLQPDSRADHCVRCGSDPRRVLSDGASLSVQAWKSSLSAPVTWDMIKAHACQVEITDEAGVNNPRAVARFSQCPHGFRHGPH